MKNGAAAGTPGTRASALDELLEAGRDIAHNAGRAAEECEALVAAARAEATVINTDAAAALERSLAAQRDEAVRAREADVRSIESTAARTILRYESLSDAEIDRLAEFVAGRVTGLTGIAAEAGT